VSVNVRSGSAGARRRFAQAACGALLAACATAPSVEEGDRYRISLRDYRTGITFSLVNRGAFADASTERRGVREGGTKEVSPNWIEYLLERLWNEGFDEIADAGFPPVGTPGLLYGVTVERNGTTRSALRRRMDDPERARTLSTMLAAFREVFDSAWDAQTVDNPEGADMFESLKRELERRRKARGVPPGA
jgi:hypothetical protein